MNLLKWLVKKACQMSFFYLLFTLFEELEMLKE